MIQDRRTILEAAAAASVVPAVGLPARARAQSTTLKIGVLNDRSGVYRELSGPKSVACVRQAIADSGIAAKGVNVEVVSADHQNKPDVGATIARQWIDRDGVGVIVDVPHSAVARLKAIPTDNDCFGHGTIRADGRKLHPAYLFDVKAPGDSKGLHVGA
jgi:branched-chain amino acid transport system substrate-binding protein